MFQFLHIFSQDDELFLFSTVLQFKAVNCKKRDTHVHIYIIYKNISVIKITKTYINPH